MKYFVYILFSIFCALSALGAAYDTNNMQAVLADEFGIFGSPTNGIMSSLEASNYNGSPWAVWIGSNPFNPSSYIFGTNWSNGSEFLVGTNSHVAFIDEWGTTFKFSTNGSLTISMTNGVTFSETNGTLSITTNGAPYGSIIISNAAFNVLNQPSGFYMPTNGSWSIFNVTNPMVSRGITNFDWIGPSNRSWIQLQYNSGALLFSNLIYVP